MTRFLPLLIGVLLVVVSGAWLAEEVHGQDPYLGEIRMFAGTFAPRGWMTCEGQLLQISRHSALFSLLGTTYGGDGKTTFALPDLRGRAPVHRGQGPGLPKRKWGEKSGSEKAAVRLHSSPTGAQPFEPQPPGEGEAEVQPLETADLEQPLEVDTRAPTLAINFIICVAGVYPERARE